MLIPKLRANLYRKGFRFEEKIFLSYSTRSLVRERIGSKSQGHRKHRTSEILYSCSFIHTIRSYHLFTSAAASYLRTFRCPSGPHSKKPIFIASNLFILVYCFFVAIRRRRRRRRIVSILISRPSMSYIKKVYDIRSTFRARHATRILWALFRLNTYTYIISHQKRFVSFNVQKN